MELPLPLSQGAAGWQDVLTMPLAQAARLAQTAPLAEATPLAQAEPEVRESRVKDFIIIFLIVVIIRILCF
jgi:hypothetical protein